MKVGNKVLGLAVGQKSILVAEVTSKGGRFSVSRTGEFTFPDGVALSNPERLGAALQEFLKANRFSARGAVIGIPAKRLLTRRKDLPPAPLAVVASTLRLQTETEFAEAENLIIDYAGQTSADEPSTVLVIATNRVEVDELSATAKAAGLKVHGITSTTAALGRATSRLPGGDGLVLNLGAAGAELVVQHGSDPAHIKHLNLSTGSEAISALAGEIRRTMATIPRNGTPQTLALWSSTSPVENPGSLLGQRLSMPVTMPELGSLVATEMPDVEPFAPAVALALAALEPADLPVDFLHSRLAPPKEPAISRTKLLAAVLGVLIAGFVAYGFIDLGDRQAAVSKIDSDNAAWEKAYADTAKKIITRTETVNSWLPPGPRFVAVLRDLTQLFPMVPNTIWATDLINGKDPFTWEVAVLAPSDKSIRDLSDAMNASARFSGAKPSITWEKPTREHPAGLWKGRIAFNYVDPHAATQPGAATRPVARGRGTTSQPAASTAPTATPAASAPAPAGATTQR